MLFSSKWVKGWWHKEPQFNFNNLVDEHANMSQEKLFQAARDMYGQEIDNDHDDGADNTNDDDMMNIDDHQQQEHQNPNETPEKLKELLSQLEDEIENIPEKEAYELGLFANPDYLESIKFRLMFLRSDRYDPRAAAKRLVNYWDRKVQLFGADKAFRPLRMPIDFAPKDETSATQGGFRLLPARDEAGRAVIFSFRRYYDNRHENIESMLRLFWCISHAALEDPEDGDTIQQVGFVGLTGNGMDDVAADSMLQACSNHIEFYSTFYSDLIHCLPMKIAAIHMFAPNPWVKLLIEHVLSFQGPHLRARVQIYDGTTEENLDKLEDYGISPEMVPPELGGTLDFNYHGWLMRKRVEDAARYGTGLTSTSTDTMMDMEVTTEKMFEG
mmetsp:Transcript_17026/g.23964  ORF Transcript_17026/g.23964 Transcript_17026/m.23964 type:complete len:385 (-) Transcript_17026:102-1256(-)